MRSIGNRQAIRHIKHLQQSFVIYTIFIILLAFCKLKILLPSLANQFCIIFIISRTRMFCCMGGGKKKEDQVKSQRRELSKNKKPEDFMKDVIPLSLSDKIRFTLDKNHKWACEMSDDGRTKKREEGGGLKEKLELMREKLKSMKREESQLAERTAQDKKREEEITLQLARTKAQCQALEWAITNMKLDIRKCKDRVK